MAETFQAHRDVVQMSVGVFLIGSALSNLVYGILADQIGRKPTIMIGLNIFCGASILCLMAPTIEILILLRGIQGIGAGAITATCFFHDSRKILFAKSNPSHWVDRDSQRDYFGYCSHIGRIYGGYGWLALHFFGGVFGLGRRCLLWKKMAPGNVENAPCS